MRNLGSVLFKMWKGFCTLVFSFLGILGWLLKALLTALTVTFVLCLCAGILIFLKVKPDRKSVV